MKSVKRKDGWWITNLPECNECEVCEECESIQDVGPYNTKAEAEDDRKGLARTERSGKRRDFWTCEKKRKKK
jgi:hypothetical protein